ncbi:GMC oxidoreductase [Streptomyces sp. NRRL S-350]|uniref:GMC oxidoreductase n=1 Tax=Streptomyces sp. NRRL S-350 TaxID=1463902 RepID=UPI0004C15A62|nr:GMC family oxidoreductase [Streptomyces sp. NRRL S-350]
MDFDFDLVIVGAGVAGALTACTVKAARPDARILILDAGNNALDQAQRAQFVDSYQLSPTKNVPTPYAGLRNNKDGFASSQDGVGDPAVMNLYYDQAGTPDLFKSGFQRMTGGSTWAWRGNTPRWLANDFRLKTAYGRGVDWPFDYDELEPYYVRAERALGVSGNDAEWAPLTRRSAGFPMPGIAPSYGDQRVRAALAGLPPVDNVEIVPITTPQARNSQEYQGRSACQGNSSCLPICPSGAKYDAGHHVREALDLGVVLKPACVVTKVVHQQDNSSTVVFKDWTTADLAEQSVTARHVVLALNAVEIPKLWLISGLGNTSDQVGRNLMDHPTDEVVGLLGEPVFPFRGPQTTLGIESFRDGAFRKDGGAFRMTIGNDGWGRTESPEAALDRLMWDKNAQKIRLTGAELQQAVNHRVTRMLRFSYATEQLPDPGNRVTLSAKTDVLGLPHPKLTYRIDDYSKAALAYGHSVAHRIWQYLESTVGADEVAPAAPAGTYKGSGHLMGTMRMGTTPADSVVDPSGRSHDHPGIWVVGSAVFPTGGTSNPTLTLSAVTLRTADTLAAAL